MGFEQMARSKVESAKKQKLMQSWDSWFTEKNWVALQRLCSIPPFNSPNLLDEILQQPIEWLNFINDLHLVSNISIPGIYLAFEIYEDRDEIEIPKQKKLNSNDISSPKSNRLVNTDDLFKEDLDDSESLKKTPNSPTRKGEKTQKVLKQEEDIS